MTPNEELRNTPLWKAINNTLLNQDHAGNLIEALWAMKDVIKNLTPRQLTAVHGAYDHMIMFKALGCNIQGHAGENVNIMSDLIAGHFDAMRYTVNLRTMEYITLQILE